jgi:hypothetical protein
MTEDGRTALYRLFSAKDELLYVGIADDPQERWKAHRTRAWWSQVVHKSVEWLPCRSDALTAELVAIRTECPTYNEAGKPYDFEAWHGVPGGEEWLSLTDTAARVVELGYAATMTRQRISQLARSDKSWPVPETSWRRVGQIRLMPWEPVEQYFKSRQARPGRPARAKTEG